jgi:formylglycine-generating enzyme required for sulfatase activity
MSQHYDALMSYTRFDDQNDGAFLTAFCERLSHEVRAHSGQEFRIFQDIEDIKWGQLFEQRIDHTLDTITFFIPILTPSFFASDFCRYELKKFLMREQQFGRSDLVLPVYYIEVAALEDKRLHDDDPLAQTLAARQRIDWRELRFEELNSPQVRRTLAQMAKQIAQHVIVQERERKRREAAEQRCREAEERERQRQRRPAWMLLPTVGVVALLAALALFVILGSGRDETAEPIIKPLLPATASEPVVTEIAPGVMMEFVEVPAGPFLMGSSDVDPNANDDEKPQHELYLPTYWIGKAEVTNAQFRPFVEGGGYSNPNYWTADGWTWREAANRMQPTYWDNDEWNGDEQPVVSVTWYEAMAYTAWLSAQTGENYRLPTEAEWEKAACGTGDRIYPWGNQEPDDRQANVSRTVGRTVPVGSYPAGASPYGALDMAGNVWEWTRSVYQDYPYDPSDGREDISNPAGKIFTVRGGSWWSDEADIRCAARFRDNPFNYVNYNGGFRVLLYPDGSS